MIVHPLLLRAVRIANTILTVRRVMVPIATGVSARTKGGMEMRAVRPTIVHLVFASMVFAAKRPVMMRASHALFRIHCFPMGYAVQPAMAWIRVTIAVLMSVETARV